MRGVGGKSCEKGFLIDVRRQNRHEIVASHHVATRGRRSIVGHRALDQLHWPTSDTTQLCIGELNRGPDAYGLQRVNGFEVGPPHSDRLARGWAVRRAGV